MASNPKRSFAQASASMSRSQYPKGKLEGPSMERPHKGQESASAKAKLGKQETKRNRVSASAKNKGKQDGPRSKGKETPSNLELPSLRGCLSSTPSSLASSVSTSPTSSPPTPQPFKSTPPKDSACLSSQPCLHTSSLPSSGSSSLASGSGPKGKLRPVLRKPKQRGATLMYIVSYGTPQKLLPAEEMCHRVSPHPKKLKELHPSQVGIKGCARIACASEGKKFGDKQLDFLKDISNMEVVQSIVRNAVDEVLAKERKRQFFLEDIDRGVALRSLVAEWKNTTDGKVALKVMMEAINHSYERTQKETPGCHHRRVQDGDVLVELKHLIKSTNSEIFLQAAANAISLSTELPGEKFLELIQSYVSTNKQVHPVWTHDKLQRLVDLVKQGDLQVGGVWVLKMAADIAKGHHWKLSM